MIRRGKIEVSKNHSGASLAPSIVITAVRQYRDLCKQKGLAMSQIILLVCRTNINVCRTYSNVCIVVEILSLKRTDVTGFSGNVLLSM